MFQEFFRPRPSPEARAKMLARVWAREADREAMEHDILVHMHEVIEDAKLDDVVKQLVGDSEPA